MPHVQHVKHEKSSMSGVLIFSIACTIKNIHNLRINKKICSTFNLLINKESQKKLTQLQVFS